MKIETLREIMVEALGTENRVEECMAYFGVAELAVECLPDNELVKDILLEAWKNGYPVTLPEIRLKLGLGVPDFGDDGDDENSSLPVTTTPAPGLLAKIKTGLMPAVMVTSMAWKSISSKWRLIGGGALAVGALCLIVAIVAGRAFEAGKQYQGRPLVVRQALPPESAPKETEIVEVVRTEFKTLLDETRALERARQEGLQESIAEIDKKIEQYREAARNQNWREAQADFSRRGAEQTGYIIPITRATSSAPQATQQGSDEAGVEPTPVEPIQDGLTGDGIVPESSAEPQP